MSEVRFSQGDDLEWGEPEPDVPGHPIQSANYKCGHCGERVSCLPWKEGRSYMASGMLNEPLMAIHICPMCQLPTLLDYTKKPHSQVPPPLYGTDVPNMPELIAALYEEVRKCVSVGAFTAATLAGRSLLHHLAVEHGAKEGISFAASIKHIEDAGLIAPKMKPWVDAIRTIGNDGAHKIRAVERQTAIDAASFIEALLRLTYDYPSRAQAHTKPSAKDEV